MDKRKLKKLQKNKWKVVTVEEFLELTPEENAEIESRLTLSRQSKRKPLKSNK